MPNLDGTGPRQQQGFRGRGLARAGRGFGAVAVDRGNDLDRTCGGRMRRRRRARCAITIEPTPETSVDLPTDKI